MTPEDLRAKARELDAAADAALARGDARATAVAAHQANVARLAADELERLGGPGTPLHQRSRQRNVNAAMFSAESRVNMSRGTNAPSSKLAALGRELKPPMSLAAIAEHAGISKGLLTMALKGERSIPTAAAEKIKARTGYPLDAWKKLG